MCIMIEIYNASNASALQVVIVVMTSIAFHTTKNLTDIVTALFIQLSIDQKRLVYNCNMKMSNLKIVYQ